MPTLPVTSAPYNPATDPATMSGARNDSNYIGSTNFAALQKQYTPYQIEQATERRGKDIFYKQGVDISKIPTMAPAATFQAPTEKPPIPSNSLAAPTPPITQANPDNAEFDARNRAAASYLEGLQASIDGIQQQQEARLAQQKTEQENVVKGLKDKLTEFMGGTDYQDSLQKDRELFKVEQQIKDLGEVRTRIADAQNALNQGLIFEEGRPTRMELLTGRSAELKKQGLAQIQSLQSTAEIIKGNIDLARAYADDSISAIKMDNDKKIGALNTLLDLENKKLISISDDEKATIKERMNGLAAEAANIQKSKDQLFDLAKDNPQAFAKGGVTFRDTLESATAKMLPFLSEQQKVELEKKQLENKLIQSQIDENKAQTKKAGASGSGGGAGGAAAGSKVEEIAAYIAYLRSQNKTEQEIRAEVYQNFGSAFPKLSDLNGVVDNVLQGTAKAETPEQAQKNRVLAKAQDWEAKGILRLIPATGAYVNAENAQAIQDAAAAGAINWNGTTWVDTKWGKEISDPSRIEYKKGRWFGDDLKY